MKPGVSSAFALLHAQVFSRTYDSRAIAQPRMFQLDARLMRRLRACLNDGQDFRWNMGIFRRNTDLLCEGAVGTVAAKTSP
jgi:hypothetical protein